MVAHMTTIAERLMLRDRGGDDDNGQYVDAITTLGERALRGAIREACAA